MPVQCVSAQPTHRRSTAHERDRPWQGSVGGADGRDVHDEDFLKYWLLGEQRKRTVNSLYFAVKPLRQCFADPPTRTYAQTVADTTITRRQNVLALFQTYAEKAMAGGTPPKGLEQAFAASVQISPSMWSQIKSARPIGDKLARQIEQHHGKPVGWLDEVRASDVVTPAEKAFLDLALQAWRATNVAGRKALREQVTQVAARAVA